MRCKLVTSDTQHTFKHNYCFMNSYMYTQHNIEHYVQEVLVELNYNAFLP